MGRQRGLRMDGLLGKGRSAVLGLRHLFGRGLGMGQRQVERDGL